MSIGKLQLSRVSQFEPATEPTYRQTVDVPEPVAHDYLEKLAELEPYRAYIYALFDYQSRRAEREHVQEELNEAEKRLADARAAVPGLFR
jgi:hypothetical protein